MGSYTQKLQSDDGREPLRIAGREAGPLNVFAKNLSLEGRAAARASPQSSPPRSDRTSGSTGVPLIWAFGRGLALSICPLHRHFFVAPSPATRFSVAIPALAR